MQAPWLAVDAAGSVDAVAARVGAAVAPCLAAAAGGGLPLRALWDCAPLPEEGVA